MVLYQTNVRWTKVIIYLSIIDIKYIAIIAEILNSYICQVGSVNQMD